MNNYRNNLKFNPEIQNQQWHLTFDDPEGGQIAVTRLKSLVAPKRSPYTMGALKSIMTFDFECPGSGDIEEKLAWGQLGSFVVASKFN